MKNFHILRVKYIPATNHRGSRVKITSDRFKQSLTFGFMYELNSIEDMAISKLQPLGFNIVGISDGYIITDTFLPLKMKPCVDCKTMSNHLSGVDRCVPCTTKWIKNR